MRSNTGSGVSSQKILFADITAVSRRSCNGFSHQAARSIQCTNVDVGGSIKSKIHMDGVILHPTLYVDGVKRIDNGRILVPIE